MEQIRLENEQIEVTVNIHGAELRSLKSKADGQEYLWNADAKYWGRTSPVLFPFVGGVKNKVYRHEGKEYPMNQHGFARDMAPESLTNTVFGEGGVVTTQKKEYKLTDGFLSIDEHLFDGDALVIEGHQIQRVALTDPQRKEYLAVEFDAPLAGIWSPPKKQAPFVCIEPWYGRCDSERFDGELKDRDWENALEAGGEFEASYKIIIE